MIRINFARFFCRSLYPHYKCQLVTSISTSATFQVDTRRKKFLQNTKRHLDSERDRYADTFGDLESFEQKFQRIKEDPEDIKEYEQEKAAQGKNFNQYMNEIKLLLAENKYEAAVKILEVDMRNDKIRFPGHIYKILLCYNGLIGNVEEAYRLYTDYKERGGIVTGAMYTSLFNACANCKNSILALKRADDVREYMYKSKHHKINLTNYNAMMKAYGRHGHISECLKIMDEVMDKVSKVSSKTYSFLFQACISDSNSGLRHAFIVWRKMLQNRTRPCIYTYNLMLRCIRDCSLGEVLLIPDVLNQIIEESKHFYKRKTKFKMYGSEEVRVIRKIPADGSKLITPVEAETKSEEQVKRDTIDLGSVDINESADQKEETSASPAVDNHSESSLSTSDNESSSNESLKTNPPYQSDFKLPNLLALEPTLGSAVEFKTMTNPEDRFLLVGGVNEFLKTMKEFRVEPDGKTFCLLLSLIPKTKEAEEKLMELADSHGVKLDIVFFNILIKKRISRDERHTIKDCLDQMVARNLKPDIITFGTLACSCHTHELGVELLENIHQHGYRANSIIIYNLLRKVKDAGDMKYMLTVLRAAREDDVELNPKCLSLITLIVNEEKRKKRLKESESSMRTLNECTELLSDAESKSTQDSSCQI